MHRFLPIIFLFKFPFSLFYCFTECFFSSSFRYYKASLLFVFVFCYLPFFRCFNFSQFRIISLICYVSFPLRFPPMYDDFYFSSFSSPPFRMMSLSFCVLLLGILYTWKSFFALIMNHAMIWLIDMQ